MHRARIAELLRPFLGPASTPTRCHSDRSRSESDGVVEEPGVLSPAQLEDISTYIDILLRWNARTNLTAIRDPEEIVTRHFGESLFVARHLFPGRGHVGTAAPGCPAEPNSATDASTIETCGRAALQRREEEQLETGALAPVPITLADVGSGAGFPGIPIKLWAPSITLTLIESNHKKSAFLREVARALTLTDINIQTARAQTLPPASFDVVTLRAVEHFAQVLPIAANLVTPKGRMALLIAADQMPQVHTILPSHSLSDLVSIPQSRSRILVIATKSPAQMNHEG